VLQQRAPRDALSALLVPLAPDARDWLEQRQTTVQQWLQATGASPLPAAPAARQPRAAWLPWHSEAAAAPAPQLLPTRAPAAKGGEGPSEQPISSLGGAVWDSQSGDDDEFGSAASRAGASSSMGASFCTAVSSQPE
jgi:hypothetical protein